MIKVFASCHNHSCYSDAEYTPDQLAEIAKGLGHGGEASLLFWERFCEENGLCKMGGSDHEGELGGYLEFRDVYYCPEELSGISEEDFMNIYERRLG